MEQHSEKHAGHEADETKEGFCLKKTREPKVVLHRVPRKNGMRRMVLLMKEFSIKINEWKTIVGLSMTFEYY